MRLDFNVLWVDDQPARVAAQGRSIAMQMADQGFEFNPRQCKTIEEMEDAISKDVFTDEVDLILVDWDLGKGVHGDNAIERIRQIIQYKDVVFYSGQATVIELRQKVYEKQLEGVHCVGRDGLVEEVMGVFDSLIKKVLDLDHTRGIVMGATSDIDHMVNACLTLAHSKLDAEGKADFMTEALKRVADQVKEITKLSEKLRTAPDVEALFKAHLLFTSDHRLRLLARILSTGQLAAYSPGVVTVKSYRDGVVKNRNILGHAVLVPEGKPSNVINGAGDVVNITQMRELRKLILSLRADFRTLLDTMQA